jgi:hypothetical protein
MVVHTCNHSTQELEAGRPQVPTSLDYTVRLCLKKLCKGRGWGQGEEMTQALYIHMNNKKNYAHKKLQCCIYEKYISLSEFLVKNTQYEILINIKSLSFCWFLSNKKE